MVTSHEKSKEVDMDIPRIKYHVAQSGRAFERLLKEHSFTELDDAIRAKLDLDSSLQLQMYRVQDGVKYDLEDEDDFAAMKSAAYASDAFDVRIAYQKRKNSKPASKRSSTPSRSRRVSIVLPEKDADTVRKTIQQSPQPTDSDNEAPIIEAPAPLKKSRQNSQSAADPPPAQPSILKKRKPASDTSEDTPEAKEPPTKRHKPEKPSKKSDDSTKVSSKPKSTSVKRKSSSDKLQKTVSETESELSDTSKKAKTKPVEPQRDADVDNPPSKKAKTSKTKHDGESKSTTKLVSKAVKSVTKAVKSSVVEDPLPSDLSYAELKSRILERGKSRRNEEENSPATEENSGEKTKKSKENTDSSTSSEPAQVNGKTKDGEKKKAAKEDDISKKSKKSVSKDSAKDQTKEKETPADTTKDKTKDKKIVKKAVVTNSSSKTTADSAAANKGSTKSLDVPPVSSNEQHKTIETLVAEIETSLKNPNTVSKNDKSSIPRASTSQAGSHRESTIPILPPKSKSLQVVMQSNDEESESESESESSSSSSSSNSDGEDVVPNRKSSLAKPSLSVESELTRQSVNLDNVDLDALIRGPPAKTLVASLSMLEEEEVRGGEEKREGSGVEEEEEEEEEVETKHSMIPEAARRLSDARRRVVENDDDDDEDDDDPSDSDSPPPINAPPYEAVSLKETKDKGVDEDSLTKLATPTVDNNSSTESTSAEGGPGTPVAGTTLNQTETEPPSNLGQPLDTSLEPPAVEVNPPADQRPITPPPDDSRPHTPAPATPKKSPGAAIQSTPKTPRTVQRMKDKKGNIPAENGTSTTANDDDDDDDGVQATVRPVRVMATRARPAPGPDVEELPLPTKTSLKSRASSRQPALVPVLEKRVLRSSRMPPPGVPVKSVKLKENTKTKKNAKESEPEQEKADPAAEQSRESVLGSQWQVLQPSQPTTVTSPSQIDELRDGFKSPELSSTRSGSRRRDENHVEKLVGSTETFISDADRPRSPLFLPGASQMSPSQHRLELELLGLDDGPPSSFLQTSTTKPAVVIAPSEAETEPESDRELAVPTLSQPLKSIFPSLSELSFNKFRPSFLMKNQNQSQSQQSRVAPKTATAKANESETDDDDSDDDDDDSSSESDKGSHIPKNKRAGVGVVKRVKSRGLLR